MTINKVISFICLISFLISCGGTPVRRNYQGMSQTNGSEMAFSGIKKKMALLTFFNDSPQGGEDLAIIAGEELRRELGRTGQYIVDPNASKDFGTSKEIFAGGGVKLVQLIKKAKGQGVNLIMFGRVVSARIRERSDEIGLVRKTKTFVEGKVEIRVFHVDSNKEIFTQIVSGESDDRTYRFFTENPEDKLTYRQELLRFGVQVAARKAIPLLLDVTAKLDWAGRVAKVIGTKVYVNAGRDSGINVGDILKVITEGQEIFDPETGALLGISRGEIKGTLEVIDYFGTDGAVCVLHSGGSVQEGDYIQLY